MSLVEMIYGEYMGYDEFKKKYNVGIGYKFYHFDKQRGLFRVRRVIKGNYISYGFFKTEEEAKNVVELCKKYDWDKDKVISHLSDK